MPKLLTSIPPAGQKVLWKAVATLERETFLTRLNDITGEPVLKAMTKLPPAVRKSINSAVQTALCKALELALYRLDDRRQQTGSTSYKVATTLTGGVSGFFGLATLAVELPFTTALMLRSIAGIARTYGEDLNSLPARMACLEVLALCPTSGRAEQDGSGIDSSYYAVRTFLARSVTMATEAMADRAAAQRSAPIVIELVTAIGSRFGLVVSEKAAAGAVPVIGALGAAAVNLAFMDHFQKLAHAHFAVRRLERQFGLEEVRFLYHAYAEFDRHRRSALPTNPIPS